jgi:hypothetical protein
MDTYVFCTCLKSCAQLLLNNVIFLFAWVFVIQSPFVSVRGVDQNTFVCWQQSWSPLISLSKHATIRNMRTQPFFCRPWPPDIRRNYSLVVRKTRTFLSHACQVKTGKLRVKGPTLWDWIWVYCRRNDSSPCFGRIRSSSGATRITPAAYGILRPGTHYPHVTWTHVMLRVQLGYLTLNSGAHSHFCHSAYITWSDVELWSAHMPARLLDFSCRTRFVRRDVRYVSRKVYRIFGDELSLPSSSVKQHKKSSWPAWLLMMGPTFCPLTPIANYHPHSRGPR